MTDADRKGMGKRGRLEHETGTGRHCAVGVGRGKTLVGLGPKPCLRYVPAAQLPHLFFKEDGRLPGWCGHGAGWLVPRRFRLQTQRKGGLLASATTSHTTEAAPATCDLFLGSADCGHT